MTTKDLFVKVSSLFNVKQQLICLSFGFRPQTMAGEMKMEIEEGDEDSFQHAMKILPDYSCITVEVKVARIPEVTLDANQRKTRSKEIVSEEIKGAMGIHNDEGKCKRGFLDAKWTNECDRLLQENTRFLFEFDKLQAGVKLAFGDHQYVLNPFQMICLICGEVKTLGNMNQPSSMINHLSHLHQQNGKTDGCIKRLQAWLKNHFMTQEQIDAEAILPEGLYSPTIVLSTPRVRAAVLTRDIL